MTPVPLTPYLLQRTVMERVAVLILVSTLLASPCLADFSCSATVSYQWKKEGGEPQSLFFTEVIGKAAGEEAAKAQVKELADKEKPRALGACTRKHENLSGCISAKFAAEASLLASLGFSARKALEEAVSADCKAVQGDCLEPVVSETVCVQAQAAQTEEQDQSGEKGKESAAGKKKAK